MNESESTTYGPDINAVFNVAQAVLRAHPHATVHNYERLTKPPVISGLKRAGLYDYLKPEPGAFNHLVGCAMSAILATLSGVPMDIGQLAHIIVKGCPKDVRERLSNLPGEVAARAEERSQEQIDTVVADIREITTPLIEHFKGQRVDVSHIESLIKDAVFQSGMFIGSTSKEDQDRFVSMALTAALSGISGADYRAADIPESIESQIMDRLLSDLPKSQNEPEPAADQVSGPETSQEDTSDD